MNRRKLLGLLGTSALATSGCLGSGMPDDAVVRAEPASQSHDDTVIQYDTLPEDEQEITQTALEEEFYHACPELPDAIHSFANRFGDPAYLGYQGTTQALWVRVTDQVYATTASPPDNDPSCGFLLRVPKLTTAQFSEGHAGYFTPLDLNITDLLVDLWSSPTTPQRKRHT